MTPKKILVAAICLLCLLTILLVSPSDGHGQSVSSQLAPAPPSSTEQDPQHCTVFYAANEQMALGGNNEDSFNPETNIWFIPPEQGSYGVAYVGYEDFYPQGAINDHGLFYDGLAVRNVSMPQEAGKPIYPGNLIFEAMTKCATVECTLNLYEHYSRGPGTWNGQFLIGDSTGDSAIIEPLAIIRKTGAYQVATNFFQSEVKPEQRTDDRYRTAVEMFDKAPALSVDLFRDILNATHQEGDVNTLYSTIYDLKQGLIYLYYFHDFDHTVILNLKDELAKGIHHYDIPALFPPSPAALAVAEPFSQAVAKRQAVLTRAAVDDRTLTEYAGQYAIMPGQYAWVKSEGGKLFGRDQVTPWLEYIPESDARFSRVYADADGKVWQDAVTFQRDQTGSVTGAVVYKDSSGSTVTINKGEAVNKVERPALPPAWPWMVVVVIVLAVAVTWYVWRKVKQQRN